MIKVQDIAWLEFQKPDLARAEAFANAFGFATALRTHDELHLRGTDADTPCVIIRRGSGSRFLGAAYQAEDEADVLRLAGATRADTRPLPETLGGLTVDLVDPSGVPVRVVAGTHPLESLPSQSPHILNFGRELLRVNAMQRPREPPRSAARSRGAADHQVPRALNWYLDNLGMIVSDFLSSPGSERGPR